MVVAAFFSQPPAVPPPPAPLGPIGVTLFSSFGCMLLGYLAVRTGLLEAAARKGIASLYAQLVFPTMVFVGVADIDLNTIDRGMLLVILLSKATLASLVVAYSLFALPSKYSPSIALAHAGAWAMAASHSFDVTMGVPLARVLYPQSVAYAYLNQSVQLVLVNPVLLVLMESGKGGSGARAAFRAVATNPLVVMTVLGLAAGQAFPSGLPAPLAALSRQVANAGPFLGFLALGFAIASLGGTTSSELGVSAALCAAKLVLMPLLYAVYANIITCDVTPELLTFLGTLPASASVYSLTLTRGLSPSIVGPLVPASMLLCVALNLLPLWPPAAAVAASDVLRAAIGVGGVVFALRVATSDSRSAKRD